MTLTLYIGDYCIDINGWPIEALFAIRTELEEALQEVEDAIEQKVNKSEQGG